MELILLPAFALAFIVYLKVLTAIKKQRWIEQEAKRVQAWSAYRDSQNGNLEAIDRILNNERIEL